MSAVAPLPNADSLPLQETSPVAASSSSSRLVSLDIFRGATIAMMLLVNNEGSGGAYGPLDHAPWHGWTPTDLVFPFFLFIMGVAIPFSMRKRGGTESKGSLFLHVLARGVSLFLLGELGYAVPSRWPAGTGSVVLAMARWGAMAFLAAGFVLLLYPWKSKARSLLVPPMVGVVFVLLLVTLHSVNHHVLPAGWADDEKNFYVGMLNPDRFRIPGVLQRIAVCYVAAGALTLVASWHLLLLASLVVMGVYTWLMLYVPYPSVAHPGQWVHGLLGEHDNLARFVDVRVFGKHAYRAYPDPEGLVSTLPAIATALFGVMTGLWLRTGRSAVERCAGLLAFGVIVACIGGFMGAAFMPINKKIWTPSFAVFCAGMAMLGLGAVFYVADVLRYRAWGWPFRAYGMNAITAFVLSGIVARLLLMIRVHEAGKAEPTSLYGFLAHQAAPLGQHIHVGSPASNGSLAYSICYVLAFLVVMSVLYCCKIFLKV